VVLFIIGILIIFAKVTFSIAMAKSSAITMSMAKAINGTL